MRNLLVLFAVSVSTVCHAFGDNSYSQAEYERRHGPLKSVMDAQVVRKERHVEVDRSVLMSGQKNKDKSVLVSVGAKSGLSPAPSAREEVAVEVVREAPAKVQEMQLVGVETTINDWIAE